MGSRPTTPRLALTRTRAVDREDGRGAYLGGFVEPLPEGSGTVEAFVDGTYVAGAVHPADGAFEIFVPRRDRGFWEIGLELIWPDGTRLARTIGLDAASGSDGGGGSGAAGRGRVAEKDMAAGEPSVLEVDGARLEVPAGALATKTRISMEPLDEVPALDAGMTNVPAAGHSDEFGLTFTHRPSCPNCSTISLGSGRTV